MVLKWYCYCESIKKSVLQLLKILAEPELQWNGLAWKWAAQGNKDNVASAELSAIVFLVVQGLVLRRASCGSTHHGGFDLRSYVVLSTGVATIMSLS